jgi:diguanylate cyclase (GGDEF)-like protein
MGNKRACVERHLYGDRPHHIMSKNSCLRSEGVVFLNIMIRKRIASSHQAASRPLIPTSVRSRITLAVIAISVPLLILLGTALVSEYRCAELLHTYGHTASLTAATDRILITGFLAILWVGTAIFVMVKAVDARVLRPLHHLTRVASQLAAGSLDSRVDLSLIRMVDMQRLGATVNVMAGILEKLALTDSLTAIANRRQFDAVIAGEVKRSMRIKKGLALLIVDVDKFKDYNDLYGHGAGDLCLKRIAAALRATVHRPSDLVARYGGEEFVVLLPDTDAAGARAVATGLIATIRRLGIAHAAWERGIVTISIGLAVASTEPVIDPAVLVERADQALYAAKQAGRDRAWMDGAIACAA